MDHRLDARIEVDGEDHQRVGKCHGQVPDPLAERCQVRSEALAAVGRDDHEPSASPEIGVDPRVGGYRRQQMVSRVQKRIDNRIAHNANARARNAFAQEVLTRALGRRGLNIMEFCKAFNAKTAQMEKGTPIPVVITAFQDRSFTFEMKLPPVSFFLKKASGIQSGSKTAGRGFAGKITKAQIKEIAEKKLPDLNCASVEAAMRMIEGSARSMGLEIVG
jgi:large subunit ribosomal protein L11